MAEVNSTAGAFVLPQYKWDLSHSAKAQNFQREMADRKYNADRLDAEKKNWQVDWKQIDPLYNKPVTEALAQFSSEVTSKIAKDPKWINSPEYVQSLGKMKSV